jgi:hypothetical protein
MTNGEISSLASLVVVALVARRELRASTRVAGRLWIRPAILVAITLLLAASAVAAAPHRIVLLLAWIAGGMAVGVAAGSVLLRFTTIRPAERSNAVIVQGSLATIGVWVVVLALRVGARALFGMSSPLANLDASVGTVAVVAGASAVIAWACHRAIAARAALAG